MAWLKYYFIIRPYNKKMKEVFKNPEIKIFKIEVKKPIKVVGV